MTSTDTLLPEQSLAPDQALRSQNGRAVLIYQNDGNLVLYVDGRAMWDSKTPGRTPGRAIMQGDGNFVVYDGVGALAWASGTAGHDGACLAVQNDGNCVLYHNGVALMATDTMHAEQADETVEPHRDDEEAPRPSVEPRRDPPVLVPDPGRPDGGLETVCADASVRPGLLPGARFPERGAFQFPPPYNTTGFRI